MVSSGWSDISHFTAWFTTPETFPRLSLPSAKQIKTKQCLFNKGSSSVTINSFSLNYLDCLYKPSFMFYNVSCYTFCDEFVILSYKVSHDVAFITMVSGYNGYNAMSQWTQSYTTNVYVMYTLQLWWHSLLSWACASSIWTNCTIIDGKLPLTSSPGEDNNFHWRFF